MRILRFIFLTILIILFASRIHAQHLDCRWGSPDIKPPQWGIDPGVVAYNAARMGLPMPVRLWAMWEGAGDKIFDLSGRGETGTIYGADWAPQGLDFVNANSDYISIPGSSDFKFEYKPFSIAFWIKVVTKTQYMSVMSYINETGSVPYYLIWFDNSNGLLGLSVSSVSSLIETITDVADGKWYYVVITRSGSSFIIYVDGKPDNTNTVSVSVTSNTATEFRIAKQMNLYPRHLDGSMDAVHIFHQTLTPTQVQTLYTNQYGLVRQPNKLLQWYAAQAVPTTIPIFMYHYMHH